MRWSLRQRLGGGIRPTGPASAATLAGLDDLAHFAGAPRAGGAARGTRSPQSPCTRASSRAADETNIVRRRITRDGLDAERACATAGARTALLALPFDATAFASSPIAASPRSDIERAVATVRAVAAAGAARRDHVMTNGLKRRWLIASAIDIGGTFTDFALFDDARREIVTHKALTTPKAPERGGARRRARR